MIAEFTMGVVASLVASVAYAPVNMVGLNFFAKRKIEKRVDDATAEVVQSMVEFLAQEGLNEFQKQTLIETCRDELTPLTQDPAKLFAASLNGQKIFEQLYDNKAFPPAIADLGLTKVYSLLCPRVADLICKVPAAIKEWESLAWAENFNRLDQLADSMIKLFNTVDQLANQSAKDADETLIMVRQLLAQKAGFDLDLTGLRADRPETGKFENFFVHPQIIEQKSQDQQTEALRLNTGEDCFAHFVTNGQTALIFGGPGSGKSTWSRWLQRQTVTDQWGGFAVRVELRKLNLDKLLGAHELIRQTLGPHIGGEVDSPRIKQWLDKRLIVFIFDGFDEILQQQREAVLSWISDLQIYVNGCPVLLTSRALTTDHLENLGTQWSRWQLAPFDRARIVQYIERWYLHTPLLPDQGRQVDASALATTWLKDPVVAPLTDNPLLLSTLLMVHHLDGRLPNGRSQLYQKYVDGMLGIWDDRRKVRASSVCLTLEQKRQVLRKFALHLHFAGKDSIEETATLTLFDDIVVQLKLQDQGSEVLAFLMERSGLVVGPGIYSFIHKSIGEFLVAECVLQGDQYEPAGKRLDRMALLEHHQDDRWNTVIFLWAGLAPIIDVESFFGRCIDVGNFELAYGLVYDQYERFSAPMLKDMLLVLCSDRCKSLELGDNIYIESKIKTTSESSELYFVDMGLRSLGQHAYLHELLNKAYTEEVVYWRDADDIEGSMRNLWWIVYIGCCTNFIDWAKCYKDYHPREDTEHWSFWVLNMLIARILSRDQPEHIQGLVDICYQDYLNHKEAIPLVIMSVLLASDMEISYDRIKSSARLEHILKILIDDRFPVVPSFWLTQSANWNRSFSGTLDLLLRFQQVFEKLWQQHNLQDKQLYQAVTQKVDEMIKLRDTPTNSANVSAETF